MNAITDQQRDNVDFDMCQILDDNKAMIELSASTLAREAQLIKMHTIMAEALFAIARGAMEPVIVAQTALQGVTMEMGHT